MWPLERCKDCATSEVLHYLRWPWCWEAESWTRNQGLVTWSVQNIKWHKSVSPSLVSVQVSPTFVTLETRMLPIGNSCKCVHFQLTHFIVWTFSHSQLQWCPLMNTPREVAGGCCRNSRGATSLSNIIPSIRRVVWLFVLHMMSNTSERLKDNYNSWMCYSVVRMIHQPVSAELLGLLPKTLSVLWPFEKFWPQGTFFFRGLSKRSPVMLN